jgi:hypothetical protein
MNLSTMFVTDRVTLAAVGGAVERSADLAVRERIYTDLGGALVTSIHDQMLYALRTEVVSALT